MGKDDGEKTAGRDMGGADMRLSVVDVDPCLKLFAESMMQGERERPVGRRGNWTFGLLLPEKECLGPE
jgi:hypothetical protein